MSYQDILDQYAGLLIVQYKTKDKAKATVRLLVNSSVCDGLPLSLQNCFNLDTAFGNQLTILGKVLGVPRDVIGLDLSHQYFTFTNYIGSPASVGFWDYSNTPPDTYHLLDYNYSFSYTMTDFEMAVVLKLAIIQNSGPLTYKNIKNKLWNYFGGQIDIVPTYATGTYFTMTNYVGSPASNGFQDYISQPDVSGITLFDYSDYEIMTIDYRVKSIYTTAVTVAQFLSILPHPMAVTTNIVYFN